MLDVIYLASFLTHISALSSIDYGSMWLRKSMQHGLAANTAPRAMTRYVRRQACARHCAEGLPYGCLDIISKGIIMDVINRSVVVIKPQEPYYNWITELPGAIGVAKEMMEATVLLISDMLYPSGIEGYMRQIFDQIFTIQLESLETDVKEWPQNRNYEMFLQWFKVEVHPLVLDALEETIQKEPYK